jgi:hypothetical protein
LRPPAAILECSIDLETAAPVFESIFLPTGLNPQRPYITNEPMNMNKDEVIKLLRGSFESPTSTPSLGASDRTVYIKECQERLIDHVVEPSIVDAYTSQWTKENTDFKSESYHMLLIAKDENRELLYNGETREFSLAIRNEKGKLYLVGYSSTDALAEWLG